jgi:hypothetical protein
VVLGMAVLVLVGFAAFVVDLVAQSDTTDEVHWSRLAWVFASVEAIAFGAAGALFGSSIQKDRAENGEANARDNAQGAAKRQSARRDDQGGGSRSTQRPDGARIARRLHAA